MPFELTTLGAVVDIRGGGTPATDDPRFWSGDIPWVSPKDMKSDEISASADWITPTAIENSAASLIPSGAVLVVVRSGILARTVPVGVTTRPLAVNQDIKALCPSPRILPRFLFYFLLASEPALLARVSRGATVHRLSTDDLRNLPLSLPALSEQKRLVAILDEAFEGIRIATANAEKNLANARELFECATEAALERQPSWKRVTLQEVCEKITDGTHQTPRYFESGFLFLSSRNVTNRRIDWTKIKYIDEAQHVEMQRRLSPRRGDILLAKNGTTGVAAMVDRDVPFDIYVSLALLRAKPVINPRLLLHIVNSPISKRQFNKRLKGVGVPNLHLKEIREVEAYIPAKNDEQEALIEKLDAIEDVLEKSLDFYGQRMTALSNLKQSILSRAFSGQLTATRGLAA